MENSLKVYVGDLTTLMVAGNYNLTHDIRFYNWKDYDWSKL